PSSVKASIDQLPSPVERPIAQVFTEEKVTDISRRPWELKHRVEPPASKKRGRVKIFLPELPDVDEEPDVVRPSTSSAFSSQLLSLLPEPKSDVKQKSNSLLLPSVSGKKRVKSTPVERSDLPYSTERLPAANSSKVNLEGEQDSEPEEDGLPYVCANFFSIDSHSTGSVREEAPLPSLVKVVGPESIPIAPVEFPVAMDDANVYEVPPEACSSHDSMAESFPGAGQKVGKTISIEQARKLIKKHETDPFTGRTVPDDLQIIDVNVDTQLEGVRENLLRNLTGPKAPDAMLNAAKKEDTKVNPGGVAKRKHQITYLAFLAKEREEQLQNQWAQNRHTRKQSRMKYGF
ncbi:unnamed protein product, partial [Soboliphyme baturini]|uniref:Proline-rich protein PRCC n=1 Tax=Soboliphyme baturini TaxID=241478 RepID=A0A183IMZ6_9BILA